jgi:1,2-phenylacetyl-CoA epoxidase catalytic subunit
MNNQSINHTFLRISDKEANDRIQKLRKLFLKGTLKTIEKLGKEVPDYGRSSNN